MTRILITGGRGFLGRNLAAHLLERKDCETTVLGHEDSDADFRAALLSVDLVFHLAGVNRTKDLDAFSRGNTELTERLCQYLQQSGRSPTVVYSSSIQVAKPPELHNPYGVSKANAEKALLRFAAETGARVRIYRLKNLFGKWGRPNYNSVTATFCHNIANDLPITLPDPARELDLSYVDDVMAAFLAEIQPVARPVNDPPGEPGANIPSYRIQLADLAGRLQAFHEARTTLLLPDFTGWFNRALYATYLSYLPAAARGYNLEASSDARGSLAEFLKQPQLGQIFVSRTSPGVTRGNHYHHTKAEKFFVVEGEGLIRIRAVEGGPVDEYAVTGSAYRVIDIPPGFTHSITNVGTGEMVTLFWASERFDPDRPDTYSLPLAMAPTTYVQAVDQV